MLNSLSLNIPYKMENKCQLFPSWKDEHVEHTKGGPW